MDFGTIESIVTARNLETGEDVRLAQVNAVGEDTVTVELPFAMGDECVPVVGDTVYYSEVDSGFLVGQYIQSTIAVDTSLDDGERELFSRSGNSREATVRLRNNGEVVLNDGSDFAVMFDELNTALQSMLSTMNTIRAAVMGHGHASFNTPSAQLTPYATTEYSLDISGAKVDKVRL